MTANLTVLNKQQCIEIQVLRFFDTCIQQKITPFVGTDSSVGMEYEMQVAVEGTAEDVDLPQTLLHSNYYKNIRKRAERGDLSRGRVGDLHHFIFNNDSHIWENSWVRFSDDVLSQRARALLDADLLVDKKRPEMGFRSDASRYRSSNGELHLPISYLLKLAMADAFAEADLPEDLFELATTLLFNLQSDNTSPEILSFSVLQAGCEDVGTLAAAETARTLLITQLLIQYANQKFGLLDIGQKAMIYFAPHAPLRQKRLNDLVPDGYYRHLFMSPCLSGWDKGEEKHQYMGLCHRTLSRSRLNTISKLKDAGILVNNLVTLPNTSNTCLANNGIHVSLGSRVLTQMARDPHSGYTPEVEKYCGDLVIKVVEHFLPLFVSTYCAAPYRIDFKDFHPENVLGFLPHELDYTHLRMVWRRWRKKAKLKIFGQSVTPFGPQWLDRIVAACFGLKGDLVPDFRLIDYLMCLLSTENVQGLDGSLANHEQLKDELMELGVFDSRMSMYLLYRQRIFAKAGYGGFEGRSYSLFHTLLEDMAEAVKLQNFITALAYRMIINGTVSHRDIPDNPSVESERRQIFFGTAIDIPTFFIRADSGNRFLQSIVARVSSVRRSNRYRNYLRVKNREYRLGLMRIIREDYGDLVEEMNMGETLKNLEARLLGNTKSAMEKIVEGVLQQTPTRGNAMDVRAETFNMEAECYYRQQLKKKHMEEGFQVFIDDCRHYGPQLDCQITALSALSEGRSAEEYITSCRQAVLDETADAKTLQHILIIWLRTLSCRQKEQLRS